MLSSILLLSIALFFSCSLNWYLLKPAKVSTESGPTKKELNETIKKLRDEVGLIQALKDRGENDAAINATLASQETDRLKKELSSIRGTVSQMAEEEATKRTAIVLNRFQQDVDKAAAVKLDAWKLKEEKAIREDAIKRSQSVITGKVTEHILPYLEGFNYNPKDCRFVGSPLDFLVFNGLSDKESVEEIVFVEIKTGKTATLTERERAVRDAVLAKRVRWQVIHKTQ